MDVGESGTTKRASAVKGRRCGQCTVIQPGLLCEQLCEQTHSRAVFGSFHAEHKDRSPLKRANRCGGCQLSGLSARAAEMQGLAGIHSRDRNESEWERILRCQTVYSVQRCSRRQHKYVFPLPQGQTCCIPSLNTHNTTDQDTSLLQSTLTSKYFVTSPTYSHSEQLRRSINLKPIPLSQLVGVTQAELFRHCRLTTTSDSRIT